MTRVVVAIPARYASARFPGKALAEVAGKPLIQHVWERAQGLTAADEVLVATDDGRIAAAVRAIGGRVVMTRADLGSGTDRVAEAVRGSSADLVVNLQGDEPIFDVKAVDQLVRSMLEEPTIQMGTLAHPIDNDAEHRDMNAVKVVVDRSGYALYFSRAPIPFARRPGVTAPLRHIGIYVFRAEFLQRFARLEPTPLEQAETLEQLRALEHGVRVRVALAPQASIGVDTPEDLVRLVAYLRKGSASGPAGGGLTGR